MKTLPEVFVPKGWGYERWICNNDLYCGKELFMIKGKRFSLHLHKLKDETFYILDGSMVMKYAMVPLNSSLEDVSKGLFVSEEVLEKGDVFHVPVWMAHQVIALSDVRFMEFSTHHEDDDSYRLLKGD